MLQAAGAICGPTGYEVVRTEREPGRWCYGERKRREGTHQLLVLPFDVVEATEAWGWAEPFWQYRCDGCGQDRRRMW